MKTCPTCGTANLAAFRLRNGRPRARLCRSCENAGRAERRGRPASGTRVTRPGRPCWLWGPWSVPTVSRRCAGRWSGWTGRDGWRGCRLKTMWSHLAGTSAACWRLQE